MSKAPWNTGRESQFYEGLRKVDVQETGTAELDPGPWVPLRSLGRALQAEVTVAVRMIRAINELS